MKKAIIYLNLGTPQSYDPKDVKEYLKQFLMDPLVIDIPYFLRWFLVNVIITPLRSRKSAEAYQSIWTEQGSPLLVYSKNFVKLLQKETSSLGYDVYLAMRYGQPSTESVVRILKENNYNEIFLVPAYPQYALSSTESAFVETIEQIKRQGLKAKVFKIVDYYKDPGFIQAVLEKIIKVQKDKKPDHYFFSYHGLPKRHLKKLNNECQFGECCLKETTANRFCYRHQSFETTKALVERLRLKSEQYTIGFQSRLGSGWIEPFTDVEIAELAKKGVRRLAVVCPSFTADCLETLEEIAIRAKEIFQEHGGEDLFLIPCVNDSERWARALRDLVMNKNLFQTVDL